MTASTALPDRPKVMVVDDEALVRTLSRRMLESAGYQVYEAADGVEALAALDRLERVDAVVTDLRMPHMDGFALAAHLARRSPRIPTLIISGFDHHADRMAELVPVLPKPFSSEQLLEGVRQVLGQQPPLIRRVAQ